MSPTVDQEQRMLGFVSLGLALATFTFHLICVYFVWQGHGLTSAGISLVTPWLAEAYWTYYDFSWLYLGFVIVGGAMIIIRKILAASIEN
jgi:hypothetical protein